MSRAVRGIRSSVRVLSAWRALRTGRAPARVAPCPVTWCLSRPSAQAERAMHASAGWQRPRLLVGQPLDAADVDSPDRLTGLQDVPSRAPPLLLEAGSLLDLLAGSPGR